MYRILSACSVATALLFGVTATQAAQESPAGDNSAAAAAHPDRPEIMMRIRGAAHGHGGGGGGSNNLNYHGGTVVTGADQVYLVYWGSQWNNNDPSGEAAIQQSFFSKVGGSSWNNSVSQYCQGVTVGTVTCGTSGTHVTNPTGLYAGSWYDNASAAPSQPSQSDLAAEAARAAAHFYALHPFSNTQVQFVINTATRNNASGFGTQYCAWHSSTGSSYGTLAYTNMPYITDAGTSCGANFNGLGPNAGITIVGGHEFAETETDMYPNGGWLDAGGSENGDKCSWINSGQQGAASSVSLNGASFPVQSLWSNAYNNNAGGCVLSS
ncbi:MAG TPA: hypothetical protein VF221_20720 [Chloroflexota bacterium]